ncbi:CLAVATA3/ESR (CLE)-related protein 25-like [Cornus florida]|uniref:CLAVATA3/ESR (CLE)-related protein 25-like n=1 Tax=Cornus florida TaxID=4283 RepID=UPI00289EF009|nr:CLAVATA3/ESR (CLE)-related protein 25-like [Cornus florida]
MGISSSFKALCAALALLGFIWFVFVGTLEVGGRKTTALNGRPTASLGHKVMIGREKLAVHPESDLNMSKRRVPNGPDPIHNRRAGNSRRPPGQA